MTISAQKKQQLAAFLGSLSNAAALKLFAGLEADRAGMRPSGHGVDANGKSGLPHDMLLNNLRTQLLARGAVPAARKYDAKRIFFSPFEDFFIGARDDKKRRARIARPSLEPIWRLMMTEKALTDAAFAAAALDDAIRDGAETEALERAVFIAAEAGFGRICEEANTNQAARERVVEALGDEAVFEDMEEIRRLLTGVDFLHQLQALIPNAAPSLTEEQLYQIRSLFLSAHEQSKTFGAYILLALIGRLEKPWRALGVYYHLAGSADERLDAARDAAAVLPETLFEEFETLARALERDGAGALDAETARLRVTYFADYADGLARQAKKIGDNVFLNRVEASRDVAGEAFDRFIEQALAALRAAMPVRQGGGSSQLMSQRPDIAHALSPAIAGQAGEAAVLIAAAPSLAARLGGEPDFSSLITAEARDKCAVFAKDLIVEIRAAEGDERKAARRMLEQSLNIAAPLLDSDDIGLIRDRAAAAAVAV